MRAAVCPAYGDPEVVQVAEVAPPALFPGQVRVRVAAAAVNYPDVLLVANRYQIPVPTPFVPGSEFAGEVVGVAEKVVGVKVGDRVCGSTIVGAFAEEVVVAAESVIPVPAGVAPSVAAAFGVAHRTAYNALCSVALLRPGEELIVLGAGGGVGLAAVQIGTVMGATVTAVASSGDKLDAARGSGAIRLVNHREGDLRGALRATLPDGADVVIDPVGGDLAEPALRSLRPGGRFVTVGYASGVIPRIPLNLVLLKEIQILGFEFRTFVQRHTEEYLQNDKALMGLLTDGQVTPHIGAVFDLADTAAALRHVADGKAIGKVVIRIQSA
jgi:NADPH2:quinone reductase